ncbi:MAG: hypothetical protein KKH52_01640, partial [Nanoarchaeota archaeon]|nr:hypothetical protein [Nanoarchaeota archaeon]
NNIFDRKSIGGQWPTVDEIRIGGSSSNITSENNNLSHTFRVSGGTITSTNDLLDFYDIEGGSTTATNSTYNTLTVTGGNITVRWYVNTNVTNSTGSPLNVSTVTIYNVSSSQVFSGLTDATGFTGNQPIIEFWRDNTTTVYHTPHSVNVSRTGYNDNSTTVNLSQTNSTTVDVVLLTVEGFTIINLPAEKKSVRADNTSIDVTQTVQNELVEILLGKNSSTGNYSASIWINFSSNVDFSGTTIDTDRILAKSVLHNSSAIAQIINRSLLIPRVTNSNQIYVCSNAGSLAEVTPLCANKTTIDLGQTVNGMTVTNVTYDSEDYYKVTNITGTGGGEITNYNFTYLTNGTVTTAYNYSTGTLTRVIYNESIYALQLNTTHNNGTYASMIFDGGSYSSWNNISWVSNYIGALPDNQSTDDLNMAGNVLLYHFDNNSAYGENDTYVYDFSGNENNGSCNISANRCPNLVDEGKFSKAFNFTNHAFEVPFSESLNITKNLSVEAWVTVNSDGTYRPIIARSKSGARVYSLREYDGNFEFKVWKNNLNAYSLTGTTSLDTSGQTWYHIVGVYCYVGDGTSIMNLYINSERDTPEVTNVLGPLNDVNSSTLIGMREDYDRVWDGKIDEVAVYEQCLSQEDVEDRYQRGITRLNASVRSCNNGNCLGESWVDITDTSPQDLSVSDNRYFQYKFDFETDNASYSPELYNVTINYETLDDHDFTYMAECTGTTVYGYRSGTLENLFYNTSIYALQISPSYYTGNYTSQVLPAGYYAAWNTISWVSNPMGALPDNGSDSGLNMSGNVLLHHYDNNSVYGENDTYFYDFSGNNNHGTCNQTAGTCPTYNISGRFSSAL